MTTYKLLGSSNTIDGIKEVISQFYFGEQKALYQLSDNEWLVTQLTGVPMNRPSRVILKNKRYHFEAITIEIRDY